MPNLFSEQHHHLTKTKNSYLVWGHTRWMDLQHIQDYRCTQDCGWSLYTPRSYRNYPDTDRDTSGLYTPDHYYIPDLSYILDDSLEAHRRNSPSTCKLENRHEHDKRNSVRTGTDRTGLPEPAVFLKTKTLITLWTHFKTYTDVKTPHAKYTSCVLNLFTPKVSIFITLWNQNENSSHIPGMAKQDVNGSPVVPGWQLQIGLWLTTRQFALIPQVPGHGSMHLLLRQACWSWHSALTTHSGRHDGGLPMKPGWHEQTATPLFTLHKLFGPHGDGLQGCVGATRKHIIYNWFM